MNSFYFNCDTTKIRQLSEKEIVDQILKFKDCLHFSAENKYWNLWGLWVESNISILDIESFKESKQGNLMSLFSQISSKNNTHFIRATQLFYQNQYHAGLSELNKCIDQNPHNPTLLSNRALFYSQMGYIDEAINMLQECIYFDYNNYVPYFNSFSLKFRKQLYVQAYEDLCCSLSCLYLTRGRYRKDQKDTKVATKLSENNMEAHLLLGLILLEKGRLNEAINELNWAEEIEPSNVTVQKVRAIVISKHFGRNYHHAVNSGQFKKRETKSISKNTEESQCIGNKRLRYCSSKEFGTQLSRNSISENDEMIEKVLVAIKMKLVQFNQIYNDLLSEEGHEKILTSRVPQTLLAEEIEKMLEKQQQQWRHDLERERLGTQKQKQHSEQILEFASQQKQHDSNEETVNKEKIFGGQNQALNLQKIGGSYEPKIYHEGNSNQQHPRVYQIKEEERIRRDERLIMGLQKSNSQISQSEGQISNQGENDPNSQSDEPFQSQERGPSESLLSQNEQQFSEYLVVEEYPSGNVIEQYQTAVTNGYEEEGFLEKEGDVTPSSSSGYWETSSDAVSSVTNIKPTKEKKLSEVDKGGHLVDGLNRSERNKVKQTELIGIKVCKLEILNEDYFSSQISKKLTSQKSKETTMTFLNRQFYCVLQIVQNASNNSIAHSNGSHSGSITTCDRGLFFNSQSHILECEWEEKFKREKLASESVVLGDPQTGNEVVTIVRIFSKNTDQFHDELVGQGAASIGQKGGKLKLDIVAMGSYKASSDEKNQPNRAEKPSVLIGRLSIKVYTQLTG